jgi:hypothetical protein
MPTAVSDENWRRGIRGACSDDRTMELVRTLLPEIESIDKQTAADEVKH